MQSINPLLYVTDWTPVPETIINASGWFDTETASIRVFSGSEFSLGWLLAQGWTVTGTERVVGANDVSSTRVYVDGESTTTTVTNNSYDFVYTLSRRKLRSEAVLQDMITEFTAAYNEGRQINDRRYDEILTIYNVINTNSQAELDAITAAAIPYDAIIDGVIVALPADFAEYKADVDALLDDYGVSHRERVNTQFDNELAKARSALISRGMYNGTVWTSTSSGIEEARAKALNDLEDKILDRTLTATDRIHSARVSMRSGLEAAAARLMEIKRQRGIGMLEFRNAVITAMLGVMERRDDDYPGIGELAKLAAGLGYGEGSSVRPG